MGDVDAEKLAAFYSELRGEAARTGGVPMTARHMDSLIRLAEANARIELRQHVTSKDIDNAIAVMLESFIQSQKHQVAEEIRKKFRRYLNSGPLGDQVCALLEKLFKKKVIQLQLSRPSKDVELAEVFLEISEAVRALEQNGLAVEDVSSLMGSPRVLQSFRLEGEPGDNVAKFRNLRDNAHTEDWAGSGRLLNLVIESTPFAEDRCSDAPDEAVVFSSLTDGSLLLKLDANGNEWEVFAEEPVSTLQKFRQVAVKFHKVRHQEKHSLYLRAVRKLEESGFAVAFLSGQNYGKLTHFERDLRDYHIPDELQVVYMQLPSQGCSQELKYRVPDEIPDIVPEQTVLEEQLPSASGHV
ncbi:MCM2 [Symbiodinium necroappetens]|uniref:MCM2 protein n=1 Tax=Symbiodinium necroappetens TaxID=1628268 RepID=A0A812RNL3_9DINO|nr:MCM2 [Symbiodinium necroappetens]